MLRAAFAAPALWLAFAGAPSARAATCPEADTKLLTAQADLRAAEPARDASVSDFARRLKSIADAAEATNDANAVLTTTPGGCHDIQQVYNVLQTSSWVHLLVAYLKPSLEFYVTDDNCRLLSRIETQSAVANAYATMNRSLIYWNPADPQEIAVRDHVTELVLTTAARLGITLPSPDTAGEFARDKKYALDVARSRIAADCEGSMPAAIVPPPIAAIAFGAT